MSGLLIVQTGTTSLHGGYPAWFAHALGFPMPVVRAHEGELLAPALEKVKPRGIIVTGSPLSVTDNAEWMTRLGEELLRAGERGIHVLGVCFGHQLIAQAAGGRVVKNPRGREIGTVRVRLTDAGRRDPLFTWADSDEIEVQATHEDAVDPPPPGATLLASNENCAVQAYRLSERIACVQFHPELSTVAMRDLIYSRREKLVAEGRDPLALARAVHDVRADQILRAFSSLSNAG